MSADGDDAGCLIITARWVVDCSASQRPIGRARLLLLASRSPSAAAAAASAVLNNSPGRVAVAVTAASVVAKMDSDKKQVPTIVPAVVVDEDGKLKS